MSAGPKRLRAHTNTAKDHPASRRSLLDPDCRASRPGPSAGRGQVRRTPGQRPGVLVSPAKDTATSTWPPVMQTLFQVVSCALT